MKNQKAGSTNILDSIRFEKARISEEAIGIRVSATEDGMPLIEAHSTKQIKTEAELLKAAEIDPTVWEVDRFTANVWHQMSTANGLVPLWQAKAQLKRRRTAPELLEEVFASAARAFKAGIKAVIKKAPSPKEAKGKMVLFGVPDLHLGKLCWSPETGHGNYDTGIAKRTFEEAIEDLVSRAPAAEEAWFVLGNDFFNVDTETQTTTAGTHQDEDGRWKKTYMLGKEISAWAIGRLKKKYPKVKVIVVPGNHDHSRSWYLGKHLETMFAGVPGISVDAGDCDRKWHQWGETGIGFAHGDKIKAKDLGNLCQNEAREIWGRTRRFELLLGHLHQEIVKSVGGVIVRWLPALCPPDYWHSSHGYVTSEKAATALVYDQKGMQMQLMHYPRPELFV